MIDFLKIPIENTTVKQTLGPVVECGEFLIQAADAEYHLWGGASCWDNEIGVWLCERLDPPESWKIPFESSAHGTAWAGGRILRLFFDNPVANLSWIQFVCCLKERPVDGWYFAYSSSNLFPSMHFGSEKHPSMPKKSQLEITEALFQKLVENKTDLVDYDAPIDDDDVDGGNFGVADGIPFANLPSNS